LSLLGDFWSLDRRVFILGAARMVVTLGFAAVLPYLGVVLHQERQVPATVIGVIWTVAGLSGAVMQWVAGEVADRLGRRPVLLSAMALRTVNLVALGYAIGHRGPILSIAALVVLNSMLRGFFDPVASAMVADLSAGPHRIAAFSLQRIGVNIGWALGSLAPGISRALDLPFGQLFYVSAVITLVATWAASTIVETHATGRGSTSTSVQPPATRMPVFWGFGIFRSVNLHSYWRDRRYMGFLLASLFYFLLQAQLYAPLSLYAADHLRLDLGAVSHLYLLNGLMVVALQLPAFFYIRRVGPERVLIAGGLAYAVSYALCGLATDQASLLACVGLVTLSEIMSAPAQQTAMTMMAPLGRVGAYAGLFGLTQSVGQSLGPLLGTALLDALPDRLTWPLLALFGVAAALIFRRVLVQDPNHPPNHPPACAPVAGVG
jgi:MFS family permease